MRCFASLKSVIRVTTGIVVLYLVAILLGVRLEWVYPLYGLAVGLTVWMVFRILKDPYSTDKTFDDYFYQDRPDIRRVGTE